MAVQLLFSPLSNPPLCLAQLSTTCVTYSLIPSFGRLISFSGTLTVNSSASNLTASLIAQRSLYNGLSVTVSHPDLLPPSSYQSNTNLFPGVLGTIDVPLTSAGVSVSAYRQTLSNAGSVSEYDSVVGWTSSGSFSSTNGRCSGYQTAAFFYPAPQPQVACLSYTATSSNGSIAAHVVAQLTFDSARTFANPYDSANSPYYGLEGAGHQRPVDRCR